MSSARNEVTERGRATRTWIAAAILAVGMSGISAVSVAYDADPGEAANSPHSIEELAGRHLNHHKVSVDLQRSLGPSWT